MSRIHSEAGFTIVELLVAAVIAGAATAAGLAVLSPAQATFQAQSEVADVQQRVRVAVETLTRDLMMAGAGSDLGASSGPLTQSFPPLVPYRIGEQGNDPSRGVFFRSDAISVVLVPQTSAQATIPDAMPAGASEVAVIPDSHCIGDAQRTACGFTAGTRAVVFDAHGKWETVTVTTASAGVLGLARDGQLSTSFEAGSQIAQVEMHTYYLRADAAANTFVLRHYDGARTDLPVVDHVVGLAFEYVGEATPPALLPDVDLAGSVGPWTTYGPKPPPIGVDNPADGWGAGENCTFAGTGDEHVPRLAALGPAGSLVRLEPSMLTDGPWCPDWSHPSRYDADLLRIRRVRITIRLEAAAASLRGRSGLLFTRGGVSTSGERFVPDLRIRFDVTPRNMSLGR